MPKKKQLTKEITLSSLVGEKLKDIGNEDGWTILYFSNNLHLKVKGNVFTVVEANKVKE